MATDKIAPTERLRVFKSSLPSIRMVMPNGKLVDFIKGKFYTSNETVIAHLEAEIAVGNTYISIDPKEFDIISEDRDPMVALRKSIRAELIAEAALVEDKAFGETAPVRFSPSSTRDIAPVAAGGSGDAVRAAINSKVK